jgi:phytoene synthase
VAAREHALRDLGERLRRGLESQSCIDAAAEPVVRAVVHTATTYAIDTSCFERFLTSMAMDLSVSEYGSWSDLCHYMDGSAAVIGEMMLPILEPESDDARSPARDLGLAFQLTNFLRDVGEDLDRGRVYIPQQDLAEFGADPHRRYVDDAWRSLMRFEIDRARRLYASAEAGIALLPSWSARSIAGAHQLYKQILDRIQANDYDVFVRRARVPTARKVLTAARLFARRR